MGRPKPDSAPLTRGLTLGLAGVLIFAGGMTAGMLTDGVSQLLISYQISQSVPEQRPQPAPAPKTKLIQGAAYTPAQMGDSSPADQPSAWFPDNNRITWHASIAPGTNLATLRLFNGDLDQNRIVRLDAGGHESSSKWQPVATLYIQPGQAADIQLPLAHYMLSTSTSPTEMAIEAALRQPLSPISQVSLLYPNSSRDPAVELALSGSTGTTLIADRRPPARSIAPPQERRSLAQQRVPSQRAPEQQPTADYSELIQTALAAES